MFKLTREWHDPAHSKPVQELLVLTVYALGGVSIDMYIVVNE